MDGVIFANKYFAHNKSTFQIIEYSNDSWLLNSVKNNVHVFLPKASINKIDGKNGEVTLEIPQWLISQKELDDYA